MAGNDKKAPGRCWKLASTLVLALTLPVAAVAKPKVAETCTLWKDTKCHRFFYRRQTDFTKYTRVAVLPLDYDTLSISQSAKKKLRNNWSEFGQRDMPDTARFFDETCTEEQEGRTHFSRTEPGGANVLIVAYPFNQVLREPILITACRRWEMRN